MTDIAFSSTVKASEHIRIPVGDEGFTHKCLDKFSEFKRRGKTILLVTHEQDVADRAERIVHFHDGRLVGNGAFQTRGGD